MGSHLTFFNINVYKLILCNNNNLLIIIPNKDVFYKFINIIFYRNLNIFNYDKILNFFLYNHCSVLISAKIVSKITTRK